MRSANREKLAELDAAFRRAVQTALAKENERRRENDALTVTLEPVGQRPAGTTDVSHSLVQNAVAALETIGLKPNLTASSTDANIAMSQGIPALTMSRGGITRNAHALSESWENKDAHLAIQAILLTALSEAGGL